MNVLVTKLLKQLLIGMKMTYEDTKSISPGLYLSNCCEICGKPKGAKNHNRAACSRKKQKIYEEKMIDQMLFLLNKGKSYGNQ